MRADRPFFKASPFGESIAAFKSWESVPWADMTDTDYVGKRRIKRREEKGQVKERKKEVKFTGDNILKKPLALFRVARSHRPRVTLTTEFTFDCFVFGQHVLGMKIAPSERSEVRWWRCENSCGK